LPQRYARNAIILMNADMLYKVSQFKGTQEYAFSLSDGATRFLGKEFTAASIDLRALAVVDAAFNPSACVAVGLGA